MNKSIVVAGILLIFTGTLLGAFGAHALKSMFSPELLNSFETGVRYQIYTGLGLFALGLNSEKMGIQLRGAYLLILLGTLLFSGSIYLMTALKNNGIEVGAAGLITPLGGVLLLSGWALLLVRFIQKKS